MTELETKRTRLEEVTKVYLRYADADPSTFSDEDVEKYPQVKQEKETLEKEIRNLAIKHDALESKSKQYKRSEEFGAGFGVKVKSQATRQDVNNAIRLYLFKDHPQIHARDEWKRSADAVGYDFSQRDFHTDPQICNRLTSYKRDQSTEVTGEGAELLHGTVFKALVEAKQWEGTILEACDVTYDPLENGITGLSFVPNTDVDTYGKYKGQNQQLDDEPFEFDTPIVLGAHQITTAKYPISIAYALNPNHDTLGLLNRSVGNILRRTIIRDVTNGDGNNKARGLLQDITKQGADITSGGLTTTLVNRLYRAINFEYRKSTTFRFMANDATIGGMEDTILDGDNRRIWMENMREGPELPLKGRPVLNNPHVDAYAVTSGVDSKVLVAGDFFYHKVRFVGSPQIVVDRSRFIDRFSIFVGGYVLADSNYVNPGNAPIQYLNTRGA